MIQFSGYDIYNSGFIESDYSIKHNFIKFNGVVTTVVAKVCFFKESLL